jgi:hypothetical protein
MWVLAGVVFVLAALWLLLPRSQNKSNTSVCKQFDNIRTKSQCTYAHHAKTFGAPPWHDNLTVEENLSLMLPSLMHFVSIAKQERIDGFVIEVTGT